MVRTMNPTSPGSARFRVLIVAYSARMLAELALADGYRVVTVDYFGDRDLRQWCAGQSVRHDLRVRTFRADDLGTLAETVAADAVVYGGALENAPAVIARLCRDRMLWGNSPETLHAIRDPFRLAEIVRKTDCAFPETIPPHAPLPHPHTSTWLVKPIHSGGGRGVYIWDGASLPEQSYIQRYVPGMVGSVVFVANGRDARILAVTEQLVGITNWGAAAFAYCGNLVPPRGSVQVWTRVIDTVRPLVHRLTRVFGLRGINGVDFVWDAARVWVLEVNPRPPASLEVIARLTGWPVFHWHVQACRGMLPQVDPAVPAERAAGKAVVYAQYDIRIGDTSDWMRADMRDIPYPREVIPKGHPVCTVLADAPTPDACLRVLHARVRAVQDQLHQWACTT